MTFLTISGVTEISCSFRFVLEEKTKRDKESLQKFSANNVVE